MSAISQLQSASHFDIAFPYTDCRASIQQRHHVHVYLHTNGGEVEKLGLALRKFSFTIPAHDTLQPPWRNFYSLVLPKLWAKWQSGETGPAVIPSIGRIQAFAPEATRSIRASASGEPVEVQLLEDSRTLSTIDALFTPSAQALPTQLRTTIRATAPVVEPSLLSRLLDAVSQAESLLAQGNTYARQWTAQISHIVNLCEAVYRLPALALPENFAMLDTVLELQAMAVRLRREQAYRSRTLLIWPVATPSRMSVVQIAAWIYGNTARAPELLMVNDWDPLNVPRGSIVRHYA